MVVGCFGYQGCEIASARDIVTRDATRFPKGSRVAFVLEDCVLTSGRLFDAAATAL